MLDAGTGIATSIGWGIADFLGGAASRRLSVLVVLLWSQLIGAVAATACAVMFFGVPNDSGILIGGLGGVCGGIGIIAFYSALARAPMGLVAPMSACSGVVVMSVALVRGESPGSVALLGCLIAFIGIVLVARSDQGADQEGHIRFDRVALLCTLMTIMAFGAALSLLDMGAGEAGLATSIWAAVMLRYGSLAFIVVAVIATRTHIVVPERRAVLPICGIGIFEMISNALFAVGAAFGNLAVLSVTSSMYPLTTAALARYVLGERLTSSQLVGAACTLAGAVLLSIPS